MAVQLAPEGASAASAGVQMFDPTPGAVSVPNLGHTASLMQSLNAPQFISGIQALVYLPVMQAVLDRANGLHTAGFISGYRGSPLGGLDQALWRERALLEQARIEFQPGLNEDLAATSVWGSQQTNLFQGAKYDGVFSYWYGKGPGVDRSGDAIKHANFAGTSAYGGVLAIAGDDHASKSSTLPHQSDHAFIHYGIPVLNPSDIQELLRFGLLGWAMSRFSGLWVGLKAYTDIMDANAIVSLHPSIADIHVPSPEQFVMPSGGLNIRWPDTPQEQETRVFNERLPAIAAFARHNAINQITWHADKPAQIGIVATGKAYTELLQALEDLGIDEAAAETIGIRLLKIGMPWPLEEQIVHRFAEGLKEIVVVEEKRPIIEEQLTAQLYNWPVNSRPRVVGKKDEHGKPLLSSIGELAPAIIAKAVAARLKPFHSNNTMNARVAFLEQQAKSLQEPREALTRKPHFCSGCPHNTSTKVPEGSRAQAGIGCHYMTTWMDRDTDTFTQMGGEGVTWIGQSAFTETEHIFQKFRRRYLFPFRQPGDSRRSFCWCEHHL